MESSFSSKNDAKSADYKKVVFEPMRIGTISTLEEMDIKVLRFQNKKLAVRLEDRKRIESELRQRIEQLEKRQTQDDAVLNVINRYWNQLNEDVRLMLLRFDAESAHDLETQSETEAATSFLMQLSTWDKEELDEKLANRVQVSKRAVAKIIQVYDRLLLKYEKMLNFLETLPEINFGDNAMDADMGKVSVKFEPNDSDKSENRDFRKYDNSMECDGDSTVKLESLEQGSRDVKMDVEGCVKNEEGESSREKFKNPSAVVNQFKDMYSKCLAENIRLHQIITSLQESQHSMSLKFKGLQDTLNVRETEIAELQNRVDDVEYENSKLQTKNCRMEHYLAETLEKMKNLEQALAERGTPEPADPVQRSNVNHKKMEELAEELEEQRELATNTLQELEQLNIKYRENLKKVEELQMNLKHLPESVVVETHEYKILQSRFSVLYNDSMQVRTQLEDYQTQIQSLQSSYLRKMEVMETEELVTQKRLRTELLQMDDVNSQLRKEYEMLRMEFEQNLVANEQTGPINREMRHLITSLQDHNVQLKSDVHRYKRKYKELSAELGRNKKLQENQKMRHESESSTNADKEKKNETAPKDDLADSKAMGDAMDVDLAANAEAGHTLNASDKDKCNSAAKDEAHNSDVREASPHKRPPSTSSSKSFPPPGDSSAASNKDNQSRAKDSKELKDVKDSKNSDNECIRDLRNQLKKAINEQKELKLLLDMHKTISKDKRDKVQLMLVEKKLRAELEDLKQQMRRLQESKREGYKKLADEDALQRIKHLEEQNHSLQKQVQLHKQEEEALLSEMEVTGQAFEDMQEQNSRLIQQLREKDEANFKLMTERIKSNQLYKVSREEKDILQEKINVANKQLDSINAVVHKLEEKEKIYQTALGNLEKEMLIRQQALELHKRKAIENAQSANDLKLHLEKYHAQMKEAQQIVSEKTSALEAEAYKNNRLQEEIAQYKRKLERMKKIEAAGTPNIVLMEEIKEYKETLTCPSCKVKRKDAVLTKCFHVFCWDCVKARYETRQRKCPKCNAAFGANDYHRLYLGN